MATIREYFDTDIKLMTAHSDWQMRRGDGAELPSVTAKIVQDYEGNAKYWSFFIPSNTDVVAYSQSIFLAPETSRCVLSSQGDAVYVETGFADYSERMNSTTLSFTGRIFLYVDAVLELEKRREIRDLGEKHGFYVVVHDRDYAKMRSDLEKPLAFISHDSRDKDELVRDLALELSKLMCPVWYDEYSLKVGDSLRASIEKGLRETKKCIVVLSPNFLANGGWGKAEFDSIYMREIVEKDNVILPVWHRVGVKEVYEYSPRLADKVGLTSSLGTQELARRLKLAIQPV